jgi:cell division ATPase FtsA
MMYYLDNEPIGSLVGHRAASIGADVIVTFLPRIVIDSLTASLKAADLEMGSLTLEPIAAIQTAIPPSMRRLNLALVDIGAGTSDIALTRDGMVFAYGMVAVAGDEITEALCQNYLLDFNEGERLKQQFQRKAPLAVQNVLGQKIQPSSGEVAEIIIPMVKTLASTIGQEILRLGGTPPQAVICIGGGSLTPFFPEKLGESLKLPASLVAVRGREALQNVEGYRDTLSGPDCITPIAIAVNAKTAASVFIPVVVNGRTLRLLSVSKPTVKEALLAAGIGPRDLQGRPGAALTLTINGQTQVIPGTMGKPAVIRVGDEVASLDMPIMGNADITIERGEPGEDASPLIKDLIALPPPLTICWRDGDLVVPPIIVQNGRKASEEDSVADRDVIDIMPRRSVGDAVQWLQNQGEIPVCSELHYTLNGKQYVHRPGITVWLNDVQATEGMELQDGDRLRVEPNTEEPLTVAKLHELWAPTLTGDAVAPSISVTYNGQPITLVQEFSWNYTCQGLPVSPDDIVQDGDEIAIGQKGNPEDIGFILNDVFRSSTFAPPESKRGGILKILCNSTAAGFTSPIGDGDIIEVYWETAKAIRCPDAPS